MIGVPEASCQRLYKTVSARGTFAGNRWPHPGRLDTFGISPLSGRLGGRLGLLSLPLKHCCGPYVSSSCLLCCGPYVPNRAHSLCLAGSCLLILFFGHFRPFAFDFPYREVAARTKLRNHLGSHTIAGVPRSGSRVDFSQLIELDLCSLFGFNKSRTYKKAVCASCFAVRDFS